MSNPVSHLKRELLAAAERQQEHTVLAPNGRRRRWLERSRAVPGRRRRLVVMLAALALATAAATAGWAIVREVVLDKSFIGLPPVEATPSAPESGELVIQYWANIQGRIWVYADGRLITLRNNGFLEQRLTPEGVELLRSEIVSTAVLAPDNRLYGYLHSATMPPPRGGWPSYFHASEHMPPFHAPMQVRNGDRLFYVEHVSNPERLAERLADAASWLPASAWKDRQIRAYVASRYTISYFAQPKEGALPAGAQRPQSLKRSRILALLPAAAADLLRAHDAVPEQWYTDTADHTPLPITRYVSDLTTEEARALAQALDDAGLKPQKSANELGYSFEIPGTSVDRPSPEKGRVQSEVIIGFEPTLPDGEHICSGCG
ncbi:MAG: hypothetical protein AABM30_04320 [Actinomycetota bacterium]